MNQLTQARNNAAGDIFMQLMQKMYKKKINQKTNPTLSDGKYDPLKSYTKKVTLTSFILLGQSSQNINDRLGTLLI